MISITECKKCGKKFGYEIVKNVWAGALEREDADCPYCGETSFSKMISGFIHVYKINENGDKTE